MGPASRVLFDNCIEVESFSDGIYWFAMDPTWPCSVKMCPDSHDNEANLPGVLLWPTIETDQMPVVGPALSTCVRDPCSDLHDETSDDDAHWDFDDDGERDYSPRLTLSAAAGQFVTGSALVTLFCMD